MIHSDVERIAFPAFSDAQFEVARQLGERVTFEPDEVMILQGTWLIKFSKGSSLVLISPLAPFPQQLLRALSGNRVVDQDVFHRFFNLLAVKHQVS